MKTTKRLLAILLAMALLGGVFAFSANAEPCAIGGTVTIHSGYNPDLWVKITQVESNVNNYNFQWLHSDGLTYFTEDALNSDLNCLLAAWEAAYPGYMCIGLAASDGTKLPDYQRPLASLDFDDMPENLYCVWADDSQGSSWTWFLFPWWLILSLFMLPNWLILPFFACWLLYR